MQTQESDLDNDMRNMRDNRYRKICTVSGRGGWGSGYGEYGGGVKVLHVLIMLSAHLVVLEFVVNYFPKHLQWFPNKI